MKAAASMAAMTTVTRAMLRRSRDTYRYSARARSDSEEDAGAYGTPSGVGGDGRGGGAVRDGVAVVAAAEAACCTASAGGRTGPRSLARCCRACRVAALPPRLGMCSSCSKRELAGEETAGGGGIIAAGARHSGATSALSWRATACPRS